MKTLTLASIVAIAFAVTSFAHADDITCRITYGDIDAQFPVFTVSGGVQRPYTTNWRAAGAPRFRPLMITKALDAVSPELFKMAAEWANVQSVDCLFYRPGPRRPKKTRELYFQITLKSVSISDYFIQTSDGNVNESLEFLWRRMILEDHITGTVVEHDFDEERPV